MPPTKKPVAPELAEQPGGPSSTEELTAQLEELTSRVDALEAAPAPAAPVSSAATPSSGVGALLEFDTVDPVLGTPLQGVGLVIDETEDGVLLAPLTVQGIRLKAEELAEVGTRASAGAAEAEAS